MEDSFDNSVEKALVEIKKRTHSTDSWLCISEDGYKITQQKKLRIYDKLCRRTVYGRSYKDALEIE